ncbi:hypothetical protein XBJ1_0695 [Xenorhabdus bovienii SS-2004]|uniref:Uncharacterized protein n=1 Tax=Xenorhabdus bovienii (strain SS-2004) TaxID=406818 RepID=D3UWK1_XENBS|nr:hypothetical protein XBJ1_0695 [Xenorhabdus bovienii SS-2004]
MYWLLYGTSYKSTSASTDRANSVTRQSGNVGLVCFFDVVINQIAVLAMLDTGNNIISDIFREKLQTVHVSQDP